MSAKPSKLEILSEDGNSSKSEKLSDSDDEPESPKEKKLLKDKKKPPAIDTANTDLRRDGTPTPDTAKV